MTSPNQSRAFISDLDCLVHNILFDIFKFLRRRVCIGKALQAGPNTRSALEGPKYGTGK